MPTAFRLRSLLAVIVLCLLSSISAFAQAETATLSGVIQDPKGGVVPDVEVTATRIETGSVASTKTNGAGIYFFTGLQPGHYHLMVRKPGFKEIAIKDFQLYVQDKLEQNFSLEIGSISESVTVNADDTHINTTDGSVSTVVDRQFAENLPLNGRSFQALIQLTPGVVTVQSNGSDNGQFSVNGQRAASNYWTVDGVSANIGVGSAYYTQGNGVSGALPSFSILGGTNSLVSVDALQEFRIQSSTYAPEFGRTPGAQIGILTRSGANQFHGTVFDYLRNDILDANDWFANKNGLRKPEERQNDFGGTFSGPILKNRLFFFFSYEGLRLRLPQVTESLVPDLTARQGAIPAIQPFLYAFPLPNGSDNLATGIAQFNASYSNASTLNAYSLRTDYRLSDKVTFFARYNYSPSTFTQRGFAGGPSLSQVSPSTIKTQTGTAGATWAISSSTINDLRFNYSRTNAYSDVHLDDFGGAVPLTSLPFPSGFTSSNGLLTFSVRSLQSSLSVGTTGANVQRQINIVDSLTLQRGSHSLKFGFDFRRLSPGYAAPEYYQQPTFRDVPSAEGGKLFFFVVASDRVGKFWLHNFGGFAQDTWRVVPRLTITYGLRWDVDFAPSSTPNISAVTGFNLRDLSSVALAPVGTPPFNTTYGNIAPRLGIAYQLRQNPNRQTVLRGGIGVFYDLATSEVGNTLFLGNYPFGALKFGFGGSFPLAPAAAAPPPITPNALYAFDPSLKLPYTLQWSAALEQGLGREQTLSMTYIGAVGRRLIQSGYVNNPNPSFASIYFVTNAATSDYGALQLQYQRRLTRGLQALASYTWSHSIDSASAGSIYGINTYTNSFGAGTNPNANRGPSDFDIRHAVSVGVAYDIPAPRVNAFSKAILHGWSLESLVLARSAPPLDLADSNLTYSNPVSLEIRPDAVPGQPVYLYGSQYPGGKAVNPNAFTEAPMDANGVALRQGNVGRNSLRAFGATQWDFAVHRDFPIHELWKLQFRAEMFNVLNHANFAPPIGDIADTTHFGQSTQTLGQYLAGGNVGGGGFSPLYQIGGPRSIQLALKLFF